MSTSSSKSVLLPPDCAGCLSSGPELVLEASDHSEKRLVFVLRKSPSLGNSLHDFPQMEKVCIMPLWGGGISMGWEDGNK